MPLKGLLHKLFYYDCWACLLRRAGMDALPGAGAGESFCMLQTGRGHWAADPFLFARGGRTYLFFEYMALHERRACIACCELTQEGPGPIEPVLREECHLSYPAIFEAGGEVYMIPEMLESRTVTLYRAVAFPTRWERAAVLLEDFCAVDTTPYFADGQWRLFLYDPDEPAHAKRRLYTAVLDLSALRLTGLSLAAEYTERLGRPAGNVLERGGERIRPAQDSHARYGGAIQFLAFSGEGEGYSERCVGTLTPDAVESDLPGRALGLHTVNRAGGYEAIDLFYHRFSPCKPLRALKRRLCR